MGTNHYLAEGDIRQMVSALAYVSALEVAVAQKRRILLEKLAGMISVDAWMWSILGRAEPGKLPTFSVLLKGGFSDEQFARFLHAQEHPDMKRFNAPMLRECHANGSQTTRLRQQLDPENAFPESDVYELWKKANLAPLILSMRPTLRGAISAISLFRKFDRPLFTERENRIAHILLSEVPWLHEETWPNHASDGMRTLPPRLHTVTNLLIQGLARKQIAADLDLSIHTVNDYTKEIYVRFGVHSQAELIRRFVEGDGGDAAATAQPAS